jgi:uncharacterized protein YneF (UPF0154 family)
MARPTLALLAILALLACCIAGAAAGAWVVQEDMRDERELDREPLLP